MSSPTCSFEFYLQEEIFTDIILDIYCILLKDIIYPTIFHSFTCSKAHCCGCQYRNSTLPNLTLDEEIQQLLPIAILAIDETEISSLFLRKITAYPRSIPLEKLAPHVHFLDHEWRKNKFFPHSKVQTSLASRIATLLVESIEG